jgi:hypothetical protein
MIFNPSGHLPSHQPSQAPLPMMAHDVLRLPENGWLLHTVNPSKVFTASSVSLLPPPQASNATL